MTPEELVRAIFNGREDGERVAGSYYGLNTKLDGNGDPDEDGRNWLQNRLVGSVSEGAYQNAEILFREVVAIVQDDSRNSTLLEPFWVTASVVAEPRIKTLQEDFREWTAIRLVMHIPAVFVQQGNGYQILKDMDQEVMQRLRATRRFVNSTFVSDFPGEPVGSMERDRTVLVR